MSTIEIRASAPKAPPSKRVGSDQSKLNDHIGWMLAVILLLAPLPFGSNRPFFWGVSAFAVGLTGAWYLFRLGRLGQDFRYPVQRLWFSAILFFLLLAFLVVQTLPIAAQLQEWLPQLSLAAPGAEGAMVFSTISLSPSATSLTLLQFATYGLVYFLVLQVATNGRRRSFFLHVILVAITGYAAYGLAALFQFGDTILGIPKWTYLGNATGPFVNRNTFATFLAFGSVISLALATESLVRKPDDARSPSSRRRRPLDVATLLYCLCFVVIGAALMATQSRMGAMAAAAGCFLVLALTLSRSTQLVQALAAIPLLAATVGAVFYFFGEGLLERLGSAEQSFDVRFELYQQLAQMIAARPFTGFGGGAFEIAYPLFHMPPVSPDLLWDKAHNTYLALWAELGLVFGSIPIFLMILAASRMRLQTGGSAATAGFGVLVVAAVHSLADFSLEIHAVAIVFLAVVALGVAGSVIQKRTL